MSPIFRKAHNKDVLLCIINRYKIILCDIILSIYRIYTIHTYILKFITPYQLLTFWVYDDNEDCKCSHFYIFYIFNKHLLIWTLVTEQPVYWDQPYSHICKHKYNLVGVKEVDRKCTHYLFNLSWSSYMQSVCSTACPSDIFIHKSPPSHAFCHFDPLTFYILFTHSLSEFSKQVYIYILHTLAN